MAEEAQQPERDNARHAVQRTDEQGLAMCDELAGLDPREKEAVVGVLKRLVATPRPMRFAEDDEGRLHSAIEGDWETRGRLTATTGFDDYAAGMHVLRELAWVVGGELGARSANLASEFLHALAPQSPLEGMLTAQIVAAHNLALHFAADARMTGQTSEGKDANARRATRFMGVFLKQVEALQKLRGRGCHQRVTVEHVTVESGGQAVVGNVAPAGGEER